MRNPLLATAWCIAAAVPALNLAALAQSAPHPPAERPDPLNAEVAVPLAEYRPAFSGYRPLADEKIMPWKEMNDTVGRIGGAKEMREGGPATTTDVAPSPGTLPAAPGAMRPMPGHKMN